MSLQINQNSWHNRLRMVHYGRYWNEPHDLCTYIQQVLMSALFCLMVGVLVVGFGSFYLFCLGAYWFVPLFSLNNGPVDILFITMLASIVAWGINWVVLMSWIYRAKEDDKLPKWAVRNVNISKINIPDPEIEMPGFLKLLAIRIANWHQKICVQVEIK